VRRETLRVCPIAPVVASTGEAPAAHRPEHDVNLGTPHLGAPLEQGVNAAVHLLDRFGETRWLARQLAARSVGIKDLRYGNVVEADWVGRDPDASGNYCTDVPLHAGARHFVVVAALAGSPDSPMGDLVGDLLVRPKSASGDTSDHRRLPLPAEHIHRLSGLQPPGPAQPSAGVPRCTVGWSTDRRATGRIPPFPRIAGPAARPAISADLGAVGPSPSWR